MDDPEGDGTGAEGQKRKGRKKTITPQQAMDRLDNMSQSLGELIDQEETLLRNVMESDKKRK